MPIRPSRVIFPAVVAIAAAAILALALGGVAAGAPQAHAQRLPVLATGYGHSAIRPSGILYTGDGSGIIGRLQPGDARRAVGHPPGFLHWTTWTNTQAAANGTVWLLSCRPSCAASSYHSYPLTLTAGRVRHGHFTRMTLHYRYQGQPVSDTRCVPDRAPREQAWGLPFRGRCD
jgi:hypothetical protein